MVNRVNASTVSDVSVYLEIINVKSVMVNRVNVSTVSDVGVSLEIIKR
jgi:hypothetical protein